MIAKKELVEFIDSLPDDSNVAVDDGGLTLVEIDRNGEETGACIEVGGIPLDDDEDDEEDENA